VCRSFFFRPLFPRSDNIKFFSLERARAAFLPPLRIARCVILSRDDDSSPPYYPFIFANAASAHVFSFSPFSHDVPVTFSSLFSTAFFARACYALSSLEGIHFDFPEFLPHRRHRPPFFSPHVDRSFFFSCGSFLFLRNERIAFRRGVFWFFFSVSSVSSLLSRRDAASAVFLFFSRKVLAVPSLPPPGHDLICHNSTEVEFSLPYIDPPWGRC